MKLTSGQIEELSKNITEMVSEQRNREGLQLLQPILDSKVKFRKLDELGLALGNGNKHQKDLFFTFLDALVDYDAMGGYVIASKSLVPFLNNHLDEVMSKSREYILKGDVWHVCDNMSERSIGQALVDRFDDALPWIRKFLASEKAWLQRSAGVAIHFFSKRVQDKPEKTNALLKVVEPYVEIKQKNPVKGIGWGLKTIGKHHPEIAKSFLLAQIEQDKDMSKILIRKALTYLPEETQEFLRRKLV